MQNNDSRFDSLISPLEFSGLEIQEFVRDNACSVCLGSLVQVDIENDMYHAHCIECETDIMAHNFTRKSDADMSRKARSVAHLELFHRDGPKRTPEEILKELGF